MMQGEGENKQPESQLTPGPSLPEEERERNGDK